MCHHVALQNQVFSSGKLAISYLRVYLELGYLYGFSFKSWHSFVILAGTCKNLTGPLPIVLIAKGSEKANSFKQDSIANI